MTSDGAFCLRSIAEARSFKVSVMKRKTAVNCACCVHIWSSSYERDKNMPSKFPIMHGLSTLTWSDMHSNVHRSHIPDKEEILSYCIPPDNRAFQSVNDIESWPSSFVSSFQRTTKTFLASKFLSSQSAHDTIEIP